MKQSGVIQTKAPHHQAESMHLSAFGEIKIANITTKFPKQTNFSWHINDFSLLYPYKKKHPRIT
jgi:hypothetical protein